MHELFGNVISAVTRADLLADGQLIEVPGVLCRMAGLRLHTAITHAAAGATGSCRGQRRWVERLAGVLAIAAAAARQAGDTDRVEFEAAAAEHGEPPVTMVMHVGPGDDENPVFTIMLPGED